MQLEKKVNINGDERIVSIPQAVSTVATLRHERVYNELSEKVSIPQAVSTVATILALLIMVLKLNLKFQYRKR